MSKPPLIKTVTLATIFSEPLPKDVPLFLDYHIGDIPETVRKALYNLPDNVVSVSFNEGLLPSRWKKMIIGWCDDVGIEPVWWKNPLVEESMKKPQPKAKAKMALDYHECRDYLQEKYDYQERDYAGKWTNKSPDDVPYLDFWHYVISQAEYITNGSYFEMDKDWKDGLDDDDFRVTIINYYFKEFGNGNDSIEFWVQW